MNDKNSDYSNVEGLKFSIFLYVFKYRYQQSLVAQIIANL